MQYIVLIFYNIFVMPIYLKLIIRAINLNEHDDNTKFR